MDKIKVFKWTCDVCGKLIHSTFKEQFEYNKEQHILSHKRKNSNTSSVGGGSDSGGGE